MAPMPSVAASPERTMPASFIMRVPKAIRSSVISGFCARISALAAAVSKPPAGPFRYWSQPSMVASMNRPTTSRRAARVRAPMLMVVP